MYASVYMFLVHPGNELESQKEQLLSSVLLSQFHCNQFGLFGLFGRDLLKWSNFAVFHLLHSWDQTDTLCIFVQFVGEAEALSTFC